MNVIKDKTFSGERPLFGLHNTELHNVTIGEGESGLKKVRKLTLTECTFDGKYPLWHAHDVTVTDSKFLEGARAAIWYSDNVTLHRCPVNTPKIFRDASNITVTDSTLDAEDSFWDVRGITLTNVTLYGQYQCLHAKDIRAHDFTLEGNYGFQHTSNVTIKNAKLRGKDLFWNSRDVTVIDSEIDAEYLGWYSRNLTFVNCTIKGTQPLCYIENLVMKNCKMIQTDLAFEETTLDVDIRTEIDSVKNPIKGTIKTLGIQTYIDDFDADVTVITPEDDNK